MYLPNRLNEPQPSLHEWAVEAVVEAHNHYGSMLKVDPNRPDADFLLTSIHWLNNKGRDFLCNLLWLPEKTDKAN